MTSPTAATVDQNGITAPTYGQILAYLQQQYQAIFGADVYLGNDSQDGQFLGIIAAAINDANAATIAVYNSMSPATAQGNGLSNNVKLNGIARLVASYSTVNVVLTGVVGTTINNGVVADTNGNLWNLPATVVIPAAGLITVTATAQNIGAISAAANTVTIIQTPVYGWQLVNNPNASTIGLPVETDAQLRARQADSVALPSLTVLGGIVGAIEAITGVVQVAAYENDTNTTDANGLPPHSISMVVQGGDATAIATAIANKKTPGAYTYGTTSVTVTDSVGVPHTIRFYTPTLVPIAVQMTIHALTGYTSNIITEIQNALVAYIGSLQIGAPVIFSRLYLPGSLYGNADSLTYEIKTLAIAIKPNSFGIADLTMAFNQLATLAVADISISLV